MTKDGGDPSAYASGVQIKSLRGTNKKPQGDCEALRVTNKVSF